MRLILVALSVCCFISCKKSDSPAESTEPPVATVDSFSVTVNNGYGSGKYKVGDTVHIFSTAYNDNQLFDQWTGDVSSLNAFEEWHTWFICPAREINITATVKNIVSYSLLFEQIRGRDRLKPVYSYFPPNHKGIVYLLHGSGGNALNVVQGYEFKLLARELVNDNFAIIVTEAEEATTGIDSDADGKLRWATGPADTLTNVDYVNIRSITDTFYQRGITSRSKPRYSIGMSNGGAFSSILSYLYNFKAGISYCAQMGNILAQTSSVPFQFCMARFDNNENVGPMGNADALADFETLNARNICSRYFVKERAPLYPERCARRGDISPDKSAAIFFELKNAGFIDTKNYFVDFSGVLVTAFQSNPLSFPELSSLTLPQRLFVIEQVDLSVSDHQMYSDFNRATLKFLNQQCQ